MPFPPEEVTYENVTVTGTFITGDPNGTNIEIREVAGAPTILFHSGDADQDTPGLIIDGLVPSAGANRQLNLELSTGTLLGGDRGRLHLRSESWDGTVPSAVTLDASRLQVTSGAGQIAQVAAGPVGVIVRKLEIRNTSGVVLGYVPVYDAIP